MKRLIGYGMVALAVVFAGIFVTAQISLNTFQPNTVIMSAEVNENFSALSTALEDKQDEVSDSCSEGSAIRAINSDGSVECEVDNIGSPGDSGVSALNGKTDAVVIEAGENVTVDSSKEGTIIISAEGGGAGGGVSVQTDDTLKGDGSSADPLGLNAPLKLSGTSAEPGYILSVTNTGSGRGIQGVGPVMGTAGISTATSGETFGVVGNTLSPTGFGVYGLALSSTGANFGVGGRSDSKDGIGVQGYSPNGGAGVRGISTAGRGVHGSSGTNTGILGQSDSFVGVWGESKTSTGVFGQSTEGWGIHGKSDKSIGVIGVSISFVGTWGQSTSSTGAFGVSESGWGVHGKSTSSEGGHFESGSGYGLTAVSNGVGAAVESKANTALVATTRGTGVSAFIVNQWGSGNIMIGRDAANAEVFRVTNTGDVQARGVTLTSDRNTKTNFAKVSSQAILEKVAQLDITTWNYKDDAETVQHLGPVAQDFHALFGLNGDDDTHISSIDAQGVALAAIQGLNEKLEAENAQLRASLADLAARLEALEASR